MNEEISSFLEVLDTKKQNKYISHVFFLYAQKNKKKIDLLSFTNKYISVYKNSIFNAMNKNNAVKRECG